MSHLIPLGQSWLSIPVTSYISHVLAVLRPVFHFGLPPVR